MRNYEIGQNIGGREDGRDSGRENGRDSGREGAGSGGEKKIYEKRRGVSENLIFFVYLHQLENNELKCRRCMTKTSY